MLGWVGTRAPPGMASQLTDERWSMERSQALFGTACGVFPDGTTRGTLVRSPHPPYLASGSGCFVTDVDGHELIDLNCNYTALVHGNAHPEICEAAIDAVRAGACFGLPTATEVLLADELVRRVPTVESVRFANSGSEAVMMAVRAARAFTGRSRVLACSGAYHGFYEGVVQGSRSGIPRETVELLTVTPLNDLAALERTIDACGHELACIVLDLMPNRAGLMPCDYEFAQRLQEVAADRGIVLLVDEVITFRLGYSGFHATYELKPDLVTFGKLLGGGLPIGVITGRQEIMAVFDAAAAGTVAHGGTFTANPVTMSAGLAALRLLDDGAIARINAMGDELRGGLEQVGYTVAGKGSLLRVSHQDVERDDLWWRLYRAGVLLCDNGLAALPTVMTAEVADAAITRFTEALAS